MRYECFKRIIRIIPTQTQRSRSWFVFNIVETQEPINRLLGPRDWAQYHYCRLTQLARNQTNLWTGGIASKYKSALKSQIQLVRFQEKLNLLIRMRLSNVKKNTERKYDEINPSSSLEYVHETFCPLLILDEMGDCTCYTVQKNTGTTDNLTWTNALLNEFCIRIHFFYQHELLSLLRVSLLCSRERKRGPGNVEEEPPEWRFEQFFEPDQDLFGILCLQARDKAAIMVVNTSHFFENLHKNGLVRDRPCASKVDFTSSLLLGRWRARL